jgi:hypothetical protein
VRKSARAAKSFHEDLSEEHFAGGVSQDASLEFKISRKRFRTETMPKRKAVLHSFAESFVFTDEGVLEAAQIWFSLLGKQQSYGLGRISVSGWHTTWGRCITVDSIRGADAATLERVTKTAFSEIDCRVGWEMALRRILDNLKHGNSNVMTLLFTSDFTAYTWLTLFASQRGICCVQ